MAYTGIMHFAIGEQDIRVYKYCGSFGANTIPYLFYDYVLENWVVVAVPGGAGGNSEVLTAANRSNLSEAEAEARTLLAANGTSP
jgi:hypothetical protein